MQLKLKKMLIAVTIFTYFVTFILQSNLWIFQLWAKNINKQSVNIVTILVEDQYKNVDWLNWYASEYIPNKLSNTKALVIPLQLWNISSYDIHRMMENIYFDGLSWSNSTLIWLIMIWDIPLPVVNQDWYVFPTVYPYVDFEDQKYLWDPSTKYFISNNKPFWQAEIWHWLINWDLIKNDYFSKLRAYYDNPSDFIWDQMWYDDFIAQKEWFLDENFKYYQNRIIFAEDEWYLRFSPLMKKIFSEESNDRSEELLEWLWDTWWLEVLKELDNREETGQSSKSLEQQIKDSFLADYNKLFSFSVMSKMRENIFAWSRWIKDYFDKSFRNWQWRMTTIVDADSSTALMQLRDTLYLWDESLVGLLMNWNDLLEQMVDEKIDKERYDMDIVIPISYRDEKWKRIQWKCRPLVRMYRNFYFWKDARLVEDAEWLSIYRWSYRNLIDLDDTVTQDSLLEWNNPAKSSYDKTNLSCKSVWASYDIFSIQAEWNRGYSMINIDTDYDVYESKKSVRSWEEDTICLITRILWICRYRRHVWPPLCTDEDDCESILDFVQRWWWWASPLNINPDEANKWRYVLNWYKATDAWRTIFDMWWYQNLRPWADEWSNWKWWIDWTGEWPQQDAASYKAYIKYSSPTETEWWDSRTIWYRIYADQTPTKHIPFSSVDYWNLTPDILGWKFMKETDQTFSISKSKNKTLFSCGWNKKYVYKFLRSVVKHDSTTDKEYNWVSYYKYSDTGSIWSYYKALKDEYNRLEESLQESEVTTKWVVDQIKSDWNTLTSLLSDITVDNIDSVLDSIWTLITNHNKNIWLLYLIASSPITTDSVTMILENIEILEWWDIDSTIVKVWFLDSWISEILSFHNWLDKYLKPLINEYYSWYDEINSQKKEWNSALGDLLKDEAFSWHRSDIEDSLNSFNQVFYVTYSMIEDADEEDLDSWDFNDSISLTRSVDNSDFYNSLDETKEIFNKVIESDKKWEQILSLINNELSKSKSEFLQYLEKNEIDFSSLTIWDKIWYYADWVYTDWYNSVSESVIELLQWVVEHYSWMNMLTPDRPIDSPRYVSMQSIAWREMKFIYPDLFKIEVYDLLDWTLTLKELPDIKAAIEKYFKDKVFEYNEIIKWELSSKLSSNIYFDKIKQFDEYATPDRGWYWYFSYWDFIEAIWWEDKLDIIAEILYYQNLTNKVREYSNIVEDDIQNIRKTFTVNEKRYYIMENYLEKDTDTFKDELVIPTYKKYWYEVAYINSDWADSIFPSYDIDSDKDVVLYDDVAFENDEELSTVYDSQVAELQDECNIPEDWKVKLFDWKWSPWYEAFKCWLKKTKEEPYKLKLSFDSSKWPLFEDDWLKEYLKQVVEEPFTTWWDSMSNYLDEWEDFLDITESSTASKEITEAKVKQWKENDEATKANNMLLKFSRSLKVTSSNSHISTYSYQNWETSSLSVQLNFSTNQDYWTIPVQIKSIWDSVLSLNWINLSAWSSFVFDTKKGFSWIVDTVDHKAWNSALEISFSFAWSVYKVIQEFYVDPWIIDDSTITMSFDEDISVWWIVTPVHVRWYDVYWNKISWAFENYDFVASTWQFLYKWMYSTGFTTNEFKNLDFYYQSPENYDWEILIEIYKSSDTDRKNPLASKIQKAISGDLRIKLNDVEILKWKNIQTDISLSLTNDEIIYKKNNWKVSIDPSKLQKLDIYLTDWWKNIDVNSQVLITSKNDLVTIWQLQEKEDGRLVFFDANMNNLESWHCRVYYYSNKIAGDDVISIEIPWLQPRLLKLTVNPASPYIIDLNVEQNVILAWDEIDAEVTVSDKWWNRVNGNVAVWWIFDFGVIDAPKVLETNNWHAKFKVIWLKPWVTMLKYVWAEKPWEAVINVDRYMLPKDKLNIMYLNYFWDDWWNQWWYFSRHEKYVEELMVNSEKILTTTTQLVSEDKIKRMMWKMSPGFKIWNVDNLLTLMQIEWWKMHMLIWDVTTFSAPISASIIRRASIEEVESFIDKNQSQHSIYFVSNWTSKIDENWNLYDWDNLIWNIYEGKISFQLWTDVLVRWDNVWNIVYKNKNYWNMIFHLSSFEPNLSNFAKPWSPYIASKTFTDGTTDRYTSIWMFDWSSYFELDTNYKSIQNSKEVLEWVWFLSDFKNITLFAQWESVGEATKKFWSEFVINLWDPVLTKKSENKTMKGTAFDGWIWHQIWAESESEIFGSYDIDFDTNWTLDLLIAYQDWSIKLAKSYWWTPDLKNMQELMRIAWWYDELYVWDVDWDWDDDITVKNKNHQARVYLNDWWKFEVDGHVVCLNTNIRSWVTETPDDLSGLHQFIMADMDDDSILDIVTFDKKWLVKVFYWGQKNGWGTYISKNEFSCDTWWNDRQISKLVTDLWLSLTTTSVWLVDNAMIRWNWLWQVKPVSPTIWKENELERFWIEISPSDYWANPWNYIEEKTFDKPASVDKAISDLTGGFNMDSISDEFKYESAKFQYVTLNETETVLWKRGVNVWSSDTSSAWNSFLFNPVSYLEWVCQCLPNVPYTRKNLRDPHWEEQWLEPWFDPVKYRKTYERVWNKTWPLEWWDIVKVTVNLQSICGGWIFALLDVIQWPWTLYYDENDNFLPNGYDWPVTEDNFPRWRRWAVLKPRDGQFAYVLDNINLAWTTCEVFQFQYFLEYNDDFQMYDIDLSKETYYTEEVKAASMWSQYDIKVVSKDWCSKDFLLYDWNGRSYSEHLVKLDQQIAWYYEDVSWDTLPYDEEMADHWTNLNDLPALEWNTINRSRFMEISNTEEWKTSLIKSLAEEFFSGNSVNINIDLDLFWDKASEIESVVDEITKWMCEWFKIWWTNKCKWLPIPFNQAFLAPWKYHLFGCWDLPMWPLEWWLPVIFFPGTIYVMWASIPMVDWLKWSWDWFVWLWWWVYDSMIRIYAMPTLSQQLWIAICYGPYSLASNIPSPLSDIAWNCVVLAVKPDCKADAKTLEEEDLSNPNETFSPFIQWIRDWNKCLSLEKWHWENWSPFVWKLWDEWWFVNVEINASEWVWTDRSKKKTPLHIFGMDIEAADWDWYWWGDWQPSSIYIWWVNILWWDYTVNKIRWWLQQWIRTLLIDKWLDPQIRYIANQLTKMHITIKFPDVSNLMNEVEKLNNIKDSIWQVWSEDLDMTANSLNTLVEEHSSESDWNTWADKFKNKSAISKWSTYSNSELNMLNQTLSNPFEGIASLMNVSNLINIETKILTVKVPIIYPEEINAYQIYITQWLKKNEEIIQQWKNIVCFNSSSENCKNFMSFHDTEWMQMIDQLQKNIQTLHEYRNFPFEIYEWIHVVDRYLSEVASLVNNTIWYITYWTKLNASRFIWYIDAIILIKNVIKTYQLIIDFSVNWSESCGNCAEDTYDQYSCKLSMLCNFSLPILQIPNFKLPNILLDLSDINLWLDIILPEFNFQPIRLELPELPNIPEPPSINANIKLFDLPTIPQLPEPPELPELPSFIPEIELELPVLPPAPELPVIPNTIETLINASKLIWKIYCIVKWNLGLVWEKSVKAKVEQLTQRTYEVSWIDNILDLTNRSPIEVKNYWVDYEISSHVDFQFSFSYVYDYLDYLTSFINNWLSIVEKSGNKAFNWIENNLDEYADFSVWEIDINVDVGKWKVDVNADAGNWLVNAVDWIKKITMASDNSINAFESSSLWAFNWEWLMSDEIEYASYSKAKNRLKDVLAYFKSEALSDSASRKLWSEIDKMQDQIDSKNIVESNVDWLNYIKNDVLNYLENKNNDYNQLFDLIWNDYTKFVAMVDDSGDKWFMINDSFKTWQFLAFDVNLFNVNWVAKENIWLIKDINPYEIILKNKQNIVDWYWNAVNLNSANSLWLSEKQYLALKNNIRNMKKNTDGLYKLINNSVSTNLISRSNSSSLNKKLIASTSSVDDSSSSLTIDPSAFVWWVYEHVSNSKVKDPISKKPYPYLLQNVVYSDTFMSQVWKRYWKDRKWKITLLTDKWVYKKCWWTCESWWWSSTKFYISKTLTDIPFEETWLTFDSETILKIADTDDEVKNWKVDWQSYDSLSFSWKLSQWNIDWYLVKLLDRIDYSYEKSDFDSAQSNGSLSLDVKYILVLPRWTTLEQIYENDWKLELLDWKLHLLKNLIVSDERKEELKFDEKKIYDEWVVVQVIYYDPQKSLAEAIISDILRKWYYVRIATLWKNDKWEYLINSPWSNQLVAWKQVVWDDQPPIWSAQLLREQNWDEIVSEWDNLEWYVWTWYTIRVNWTDNVALKYIALLDDKWKVLDSLWSVSWDSWFLSSKWSVNYHKQFRTKELVETYYSVWIDHYGNKSEKKIQVSYEIPTIQITDVDKTSNENYMYIQAELSQDIDEWNVTFQRRRGQTRKNLIAEWIWKWWQDYDISHSFSITWSPYSIWRNIGLYNKSGDQIWEIWYKSWNIMLNEDDLVNYDIVAEVNSVAVTKVLDKKWNTIFSISFPTELLIDVEASSFNIISLDENWNMWSFNWWKLISNLWESILFITPQWQMYSESWLVWSYSYDLVKDAILYTLFQKSDLDKKNPIKVWVRIKSFDL